MSQIFDVVLSNLARHGIENCLEIANEIEVEFNAPENKKKYFSFEEKVEIVFNAVLKHFPTYIEKHSFAGKVNVKVLGITLDAVRAKSRKRELAQFRMLMMYILTKELEAATLTYIGLFFGGRDHTTVIHARDTIGDLLTVDKGLSHTYRAIYNEVKGQLSYES